jgi:Flp pilus assembly pilin Flp
MLQTVWLQISKATVALRTREEGQALVEYALILALVSIAAVAALNTIGINVNNILTSIGNDL